MLSAVTARPMTRLFADASTTSGTPSGAASGASSSSGSTSGTSTANPTPGGALGKNQFLQLLVAQMKNQDPDSPMDGTQLAAQLAQFSTVEQLQNANDTLTQIANAVRVTGGASGASATGSSAGASSGASTAGGTTAGS